MMEKEIKEIIEKNLPKHVGEVLSKVLEQGKKDKEELERYKESNLQYVNEISRLSATIERYKEFDKRNSLMDAREKDIYDREIRFQIDELRYKLDCEKDKTDFSMNVALGLVRNVEYRSTLNVVKTENGGYYDPSGAYRTNNNSSTNNETKTNTFG